jgi:hypothetical protein
MCRAYPVAYKASDPFNVEIYLSRLCPAVLDLMEGEQEADLTPDRIKELFPDQWPWALRLFEREKRLLL